MSILRIHGYVEIVEALRFSDEDLVLIGKLAVGQFGTVDVVRCRMNSRVYVRKTIEKRTALRARGQCSPQLERDILVKALKTNSLWAPHLLCAFQGETALKLVMQFADGGNLWDVLESSPEGKISEPDLRWWTPQIVSAIEWCHSQGFVHRDIKPHNFVLTLTSHLLLVDFGSAAPLLPPSPSGIQLVPKEYCLVPCGTCDYISPEVLQCHEEALVALELEDNDTLRPDIDRGEDARAYGRETDWWSFGAMIYEMAFGAAPFFANDVGHTYIKIVEHRTSLQLNSSESLSDMGVSLLKGVLCDKGHRLGRHSVIEIKGHPFFQDTDWENLHQRKAPAHLHLPQFTYSAVASDRLEDQMDPSPEHEDGDLSGEQFSQPFAFSALFQSSKSILGESFTRGTAPVPHQARTNHRALDEFVGFSWGPRLSAFNAHSDHNYNAISLSPGLIDLTPRPALPLQATDPLLPHADPKLQAFRTPVRANSMPFIPGNTVSIPRTGTACRTQSRRPLSDREAMQQLVNCVGMSARKKVLESGKKPTYIKTTSERIGSKKEIKRFIPKLPEINTKHKSGGNMSTTTSETESQPPSPTPRPGSALSRRSGWGGRSTPSLMAGRSTPTSTFTATGTGATVSSNLTSSVHWTMLPDSSKWTTPFDGRLKEAERRHDRLLTDLDTLEESIGTLTSRLTHI
ncbi:kinase-like protein [Ramaria rubella]|nr:kinase-like protein [Ramaria rubella]